MSTARPAIVMPDQFYVSDVTAEIAGRHVKRGQRVHSADALVETHPEIFTNDGATDAEIDSHYNAREMAGDAAAAEARAAAEAAQAAKEGALGAVDTQAAADKAAWMVAHGSAAAGLNDAFSAIDRQAAADKEALNA
jgi:hypothetical protein